MAISVGGLVLVFLFPVAGFITPRFDPRLIVACGFIVTTIGLIRMANLNLGVDFATAVSWRAVIACGLPFLFVPINTMCFIGIPQSKFNEASGMNSLMRNLGGSVGISFVTTLIARRTSDTPVHAVSEFVASSSAYQGMVDGMTGAYNKSGWAIPDAVHHAGGQIYRMMQQQALTLAYVDTIWVLVILTACLIPIPFLMQKPDKSHASVPMH